MPVPVDADRIVRELNARTGAGLSVLGVAEHGDTGGAVYVRWPNGRESVVTPSRAGAERAQRTAEVLALARSRGLPVPRYELVTQLEDRVVVVQERLPGRVMRLDPAKLRAMVEVNERFAGVLTDRPDVPALQLRLHDEQWHRRLEDYSDRTRDLLARIRTIDGDAMFGDDLLHTDFNHENVLFDDHGNLTAVIDWDGSAWRGDRHFALVKLRFLLAWEYPEPTVLARLDELLDALIEPETLRLYWAEWSLRMVDWTIRTCRPADVDVHVGVADTRLG